MAPWRDEIARRLPEDPAGRSPVLDLGAGTGQFAAAARTMPATAR
jgi:predicted RNA methylase